VRLLLDRTWEKGSSQEGLLYSHYLVSTAFSFPSPPASLSQVPLTPCCTSSKTVSALGTLPWLFSQSRLSFPSPLHGLFPQVYLHFLKNPFHSCFTFLQTVTT
jgi:hypothetical protein